MYTHTRTRTHTFYGPFGFCPGLFRWASTRKVKPGRWNQSGFTGARDSEWQWHQLGHMQSCSLTQIYSHASISPHNCFSGQMPFLPPNQQCQSTEGNQWFHVFSLYLEVTVLFAHESFFAKRLLQCHNLSDVCSGSYWLRLWMMRRFGGGRQKSPQEVIRTLKEGLQVLGRYDNKDDKRRQKVPVVIFHMLYVFCGKKADGAVSWH